MADIILYPTETLYALGVSALEREELDALYALKGRDAEKVSSWLVRSLEDIERYAKLDGAARKIAEHFLPGQLTLILKTRDEVPRAVVAADGTVGFRISNDSVAQDLVDVFMEERNAPLTCTSANASGAPTFSTVGEILQQFGERAQMIAQVIDDGPRKGLASTVVRVVDDEVTVLREGEISEREVRAVLLEQHVAHT